MSTKITIDGKEYASVDEMPPEVRKKHALLLKIMGSMFADQDGNGVPDVVEKRGLGATFDSNIKVDRKSYKSPDQLPPDMRRKFEDALRNPQANPKSSVKINFSITRGGAMHRSKAGDAVTSLVSNEPAPIDAESGIRRTLFGIASLIAIAVAAWLLFGHRLPH